MNSVIKKCNSATFSSQSQLPHHMFTGQNNYRGHCCLSFPHPAIDSYLLFSRETDIRRISFDTDDGSDVVLPLSGLKQAVALDWDDEDGGYVYWGDVSTNKINRARWNGSDQEVCCVLFFSESFGNVVIACFYIPGIETDA